MANIIGVSALNKYVKSILESDEMLLDIAIQGEVSNFNRNYKSGHCYFSLKDDKASVKAVMFRSDAERLAFSPQNGMKVLARCRVSLYERDGAYQLYVEALFPDGVGAAQMAFEQLKGRLAAEGLFAEEAKKPIPSYPRRVGLVTSKTGAALQDILNVAARRYPSVTFVLAPVTVQGLEAAPQIAAAIRTLDRAGVDTIIVARGGGSAEDLWVFNAEEIARAAFAAKTPLISAIGHEIDFTILDFVADLRAPTPSAAAELALPDMAQVYGRLENIYINIANNMQEKLDSCYNTIGRFAVHPALARVPALPGGKWEVLRRLEAGIRREATTKLALARRGVQSAARLTAGLNPYGVLARGYSVAYTAGHAFGSVASVQTGDEIELKMKDGVLGCEVRAVRPDVETP